MSKIERMATIEYDGNAENYNTEKHVSIDTNGWIVISDELEAALCFSPNQVKKLISILQGYTEKANENE